MLSEIQTQGSKIIFLRLPMKFCKKTVIVLALGLDRLLLDSSDLIRQTLPNRDPRVNRQLPPWNTLNGPFSGPAWTQSKFAGKS